MKYETQWITPIDDPERDIHVTLTGSLTKYANEHSGARLVTVMLLGRNPGSAYTNYQAIWEIAQTSTNGNKSESEKQ